MTFRQHSTQKLINKLCFDRYFAIIFSYFVANKPIWNETYADALKRDLLMSYDKFARPQNNATKVAISMTIKHVDFDEATSIFTVYAWFIMQWNDEKLKWNKTQYGNLSK